jgi:hypothetical protein
MKGCGCNWRGVATGDVGGKKPLDEALRDGAE